MAIAVVQSLAFGTAAGFPNSITSGNFGSNTTTGNLIVAIGQTQSGANDITSFTDSKGNTYTRQISNTSAGAVNVEIWVAKNITGGATHNLTMNDSGFVCGNIIAYEISGLPTSAIFLDGSNFGNNTSGTALTTGNFTTANNNDIIICAGSTTLNTAGTWTLGTGFTNLVTSIGSGSTAYTTGAEVHIVSSASTYSGAITQSQNSQWTCVAIALSDNTGGSGAAFIARPGLNIRQAVMRGSNY